MSFALRRSASHTELASNPHSLDSVLQGAQITASSKNTELALRINDLIQSREKSIVQIAKLREELTAIENECFLLRKEIQFLKNQNGSLQEMISNLQKETEEATKRTEERVKSIIAEKNTALETMQKTLVSQTAAVKTLAEAGTAREVALQKTIQAKDAQITLLNQRSSSAEAQLASNKIYYERQLGRIPQHISRVVQRTLEQLQKRVSTDEINDRANPHTDLFRGSVYGLQEAIKAITEMEQSLLNY